MKKLLLKCAGTAAFGVFLATSAYGQFSDDFESYANRDELFDTTVDPAKVGKNDWVLTGTPTTDVLDLALTDPDTGVANKSIKSQSGNIQAIEQGLYLVPSNWEPIVFKIRMYDPMTTVLNDENEEVLAGINSYATLRPAAAANFVAVGLLSFVDDATTYDRSRYQARVMGGGNWIQLAAPRSKGWHEFTVVIHESSVDIWVDGVLDSVGNSRPRGGAAGGVGAYVDRLDIGGTLASNGAVYWDDVQVMLDSSYARDFHITEHPSSALIVEGEDASLEVVVSGSGPFTYVWSKDGEPLVDGDGVSGVDQATLTLTGVDFDDAGGYSVTVSDGNITLSSVTARLSVVEPPPPATGIRFATFEGITAPSPNGTVLFRHPTLSGSTYNANPDLSQIAGTPNSTSVVAEFPEGTWGERVLRADFAYLPEKPNPWLRLTTSGAGTFPAPTIGIDRYLKFDVHSNHPIYLLISVRESNSTAEYGAPTNPGGGTFEWVGAADPELDGTTATTPPRGKFVPAGQWTTVYFDVANDPVVGWIVGEGISGDGVIANRDVPGAKGYLEHVAVLPVRNAEDGYELVHEIYFDNFEVTEVGPPPPPAGAPSVSIVRGEGDAINLVVEGEANATYSVHASSDLVDWGSGPIGTVTLDGEGNGQYTDSEGTALDRRFYRISVQ